MYFLFMSSNRDFQVYTFKAFPPITYLGHEPFTGRDFTAMGCGSAVTPLDLGYQVLPPTPPRACGIKRTKGKISLRKILEPRTHNLFSHYRGGAGPWQTGKQIHVFLSFPVFKGLLDSYEFLPRHCLTELKLLSNSYMCS